ncbi:MAG: flagellar export protein FliJ [Symbiobacterium sp.]|uniref:flagellar export protein FliJ n=1 Tax=Symbiobacterium sp. TaxID=1971213 RepID=UPI003463FFEC
MKRFRFRLERLLEIRQQETKLARQNLARARAAAQVAAHHLQVASNRRAASAERLLARRQRRMTVNEWVQLAEMHEALVAQERLAAERLAAALQEEDRRRRELTEAERRQKVLERLRERKAEEFRQAVEAAEQAAMDEMALTVVREGGGWR